MDAGKMITKSVTRRMRVRGKYPARIADSPSNVSNNNNNAGAPNGGGANGNKHFHRNLLANTRNHSARKHHQQQQQQHQHHAQLTWKTNGNFDIGLLFRRKKHYKISREVHDAICGRFGRLQRQIPGKVLQGLFNDMKLYVSGAQVDKMIQCARQSKHVSRCNAGSQYLTFGEVCFIASAIRDMQKSKHRDQIQRHHIQEQQQKENKCPDNYEVFLGGSCNPTTWRTDTAIPELQRHGISYYNPQVSSWVPELVAQENNAKQSASLLLYVVDSQTRSTAGMIEAAYLVASGRCVVLVAYPYKEGQTIMDEPITHSEYMDLTHGQTSLLALVKSQGVKVHTTLAPALQCTANILRNGSTNGMTADEQVTYKLRKLREVFDSLDTHRTGEISLKSVVEAYHRLTNKTIDVRSLCDYLCINQRDSSATRISFDQFCVLVAEFSIDEEVGVGCESFATTDEWFKKQSSSNNIAHCNDFKLTKTTLPSKDCDSIFDIFLGGSRAANDWRTQAEALLQAENLTYSLPSTINVPNSAQENAVLQWKKPMDNSRVLLFYITKDLRSLTSMILAAHYIGLERDVVLCIEYLPGEDVEIDGEILTKQALKDYNRGRVYLHDYAKSKQVPVFDNITQALQAAVDKCRSIRE